MADFTSTPYWHLGCGTMRLAPLWLNIDAYPGPTVDMVFNLNNSSQLPSNTAKWIYWCHGPEHIYTDILPILLKDLYRALTPGGRLTIATTDLRGIYQNRFLTHANGSSWQSAMFGDTRSTVPVEDSHKQCFTLESLTWYLQTAGFKTVVPWTPEQYPDIMKLNDYATSCRLVTLHLEGVK
jgi:predicted SAM-dependent methyltransferase